MRLHTVTCLAPGWVPGTCELLGRKGTQCFPREAYGRHCPMTADDLQVPCPQVQARSFPYMSLLVAALVLNHLLLATDSSILILVFNFRFNVQVKPSGLTQWPWIFQQQFLFSVLAVLLPHTRSHNSPLQVHFNPPKQLLPQALPVWTPLHPSGFPYHISWTWN